MSDRAPRIFLSRHDDGDEWATRGLRSFLEYRDLRLSDATDGKFGATVARTVRKFEPGGGAPRHYHVTGFHLIYVIRGWLRTEFEGLGEVTLNAGDSIAYEGEIPQAHLEYSDDYEVLQVTMPADYGTVPLEED